MVVGEQNESFEHLSCKDAIAFDPYDKKRITEYMSNDHEEIDKIIKQLREHTLK
eukprot:CAMPEP_0118692966 /NCGR_PEP_ID=MMETSP0800-20121206/11627_1 /TAXON_ID=210618 ORGANISM="Striatella unipunctata, Strain CCMP2910" /NCGR_SAMPLE_ID=MMETSP0800 /ASSEMBLY_ACC=CAM_ASM_000638 /LENGTH=53 /DNA_ID=CAMNT_0006591111 /DNA_START=79 /DNA_END=240 /DNA_ORIENTATION=+